MKRLVFVLAAALPLFAAGQTSKPGFTAKAQQYNIKGDLTRLQDPARKVLVMYSVGGERITDSLTINNGSFTLKGSLMEPTRFNLRLLVDSAEAAAKGITRRPTMARDYLTVFVDKGDVTIITVDSFSNSQVKGSKVHDEYLKVTATAKPYTDKQNDLSKQYSEAARAKDEALMKKLEPQFSEISKDIRRVNREYIQKNPNSPYALFALNAAAGYDIDADEVEPLFNSLPASAKETATGKSFASRLEIAKKTKVGVYAMDFTQNDTAGIPVKLSSLRGKYLLIDFWASWCGPCRKENPNLVKVFQQYKDKGFDILGVSLDRQGQKDRWLKAIYDDKLTWTQVSDLKFWDNDVAKQYGIQAIPQNYLLDPEGKIIAKGLRGEDLEKKLAEVLK
jgi:peroxiredoxin